MQPLLNIAMRAARRAGDLIVKSLSRLDSLKVDSKGRNDFVTDIDRKAEADIMATIRRSHPQHAILAEESGRSGNDEFVWIIDPLDGTTNFLHGFPTFAVSIAVEQKGRLQHAVVYDPMRQEFFTASRGDGAQLEGKKMRVSTQRTLEGSLIGTGFPFREGANLDAYLAMLKVVMSTAAGVRRPGAASLDLAYVAAGRIDGRHPVLILRIRRQAGHVVVENRRSGDDAPVGAGLPLRPRRICPKSASGRGVVPPCTPRNRSTLSRR